MSRSSDLRAQKRAKEREIEDYEDRKDALIDIRDSIESDFANEIQKINGRFDKLMDEQERGFKNFAHINIINDEINGDKEVDATSDANMNGIYSQLFSDISDCTSKIYNLQNEVDNLKWSIRVAEEEEAEERRKMLEKLLGK